MWRFLGSSTYNCFFVSVRDMMEYVGFAVSYEDDEDSYDSLPFLYFKITLRSIGVCALGYL